MIDYESFVAACRTSGEFLDLDRDELRSILSNKSFRRLVGVVLDEIDSTARSVMGLNLANPQQVAEAINKQGRVIGLQRMIDILLEFSQPKMEEVVDAN